MAVGRRLRFEILRRDGHTCRYCGAKAPDVTLTVDHVIPVALGGGDEPSNLVTACAACNGGKSSVPADATIVEDVDATALRFAQAMEKAAEWRRVDVAVQDDLLAEFDSLWLRWRTQAGEGDHLPRDGDWKASVLRFIENGLDMQKDIARLIVEAMEYPADNTWRFFCHLCWKEISHRQEIARQIIESEG